jgi:cell division protein FtsB
MVDVHGSIEITGTSEWRRSVLESLFVTKIRVAELALEIDTKESEVEELRAELRFQVQEIRNLEDRLAYQASEPD